MIVNRTKTKIYTGYTDNVATRLRKHNGLISGGAKATRAGRPWTLRTFLTFKTKNAAMSKEYEIKHWTPRRKPKFILEHPKTLSDWAVSSLSSDSDSDSDSDTESSS